MQATWYHNHQRVEGTGGLQLVFDNGWTVSITGSNGPWLEVMRWKTGSEETPCPENVTVDLLGAYLSDVATRDNVVNPLIDELCPHHQRSPNTYHHFLNQRCPICVEKIRERS